MASKKPKRIRIKPATVDVGRGPQPAMVPYPAGVRRGVLPPDGDTVALDGAAGAYWQRRINEGSVVVVEPKVESPKLVEPKPTTRKKGEE